MQEIRRVAGDQIDGMSPTVHVPAMLSFTVGGQYVTKQIRLIGVDEATYATVSDFGRYLQHPENRKQLDFPAQRRRLRHRRITKPPKPAKAMPRPQMSMAGWLWRKQMASFAVRAVPPPSLDGEESVCRRRESTCRRTPSEGENFDPAKEQHSGCVLGIALVSYRNPDGSDSFLSLPGDDVDITYPTAGTPPKPLSAKFTVVDFYESKMNEYDSSFVFVPIRKLQELRGTIDPTTGIANFNSIQIRLKPGADMDAVRDLLRRHFPPQIYIDQHLARQAGAAARGRANGNRGAQRAVVHDHRRGRLRHPGDLLHDRRREDPRHRHPQVARGNGLAAS